MHAKKVLVIDDEQLIRSTTMLLLKKEGAVPISASNGQDGLDLAASEKPDLILLDIMMPEMDGWEVLRLLKENEKLSGIPVIIFTAIDFTTSEQQAQSKGAYGILRKPFHLHQLKTIIGIKLKKVGFNA